MHGLVIFELNKYVNANYGRATWNSILEDAGLKNRFFDSSKPYPDSDIFAILTSAVKLSNVPLETHLLQFGEFIVPNLLKVFGHLVKSEWKTLDLLEHVEDTMHVAVRVNNPGATPPQLKIERKSEKLVEIKYLSPRNLPALAKGIINGVAKYYGEFDLIKITESKIEGGYLFSIERTS